jgi:hypothetical protein
VLTFNQDPYNYPIIHIKDFGMKAAECDRHVSWRPAVLTDVLRDFYQFLLETLHQKAEMSSVFHLSIPIRYSQLILFLSTGGNLS